MRYGTGPGDPPFSVAAPGAALTPEQAAEWAAVHKAIRDLIAEAEARDGPATPLAYRLQYGDTPDSGDEVGPGEVTHFPRRKATG